MNRIVSIAVLFVALTAVAGGVQSLLVKADRFFNQEEWASASAMYDLVLDERPTDKTAYSRGIISAEMRGDTMSVVRLMNKSMDYGVSFDSIFAGVKRESFAMGRAALYEDFLLLVKKRYHWMSRSVDNNLMNYYAFRRNGSMMVRYSIIMLEGLPENVDFMKILAEGYMLEDDMAEAIEVYKRILNIDPYDYESLLYLGNYYSMASHENRSKTEYRMDALAYLERAYKIKPTPFVKDLIDKLK